MFIIHTALLNDIVTVINRHFGVTVYDSKLINRGYLNEKWILHTNKERLFVKSYHPDRYRKHYSSAFWRDIEHALGLQLIFFHSGGSCPMLFGDEEIGYLFETPTGRKFVIMQYCPGALVEAGGVNELQMYH